MNWSCGEQKIRDLWELDPTVSFLNHGSYGAVPRSIAEFRRNICCEIERNPADFLSRRLPERLQEQRQKLALFLNAQPDRLAFVTNATSGVGAVLRSLSWKAGDEIVFHNHGYGWVRQGLQNLCVQRGVVVREANIPWPNFTDAEVVSAFVHEITKRTKLVICDHVTSPTATIFPIAKIIAAVRDKGVPILIDGAHAPGFLPLSLGQLAPDFYVGNLHKWVCAPRGSAFLFVTESYRQLVRPESLSYSGGMSHSNMNSEFFSYFDWTGTSDFSAWLSISNALEFNEMLGWQELFNKRQKLIKDAKRLFIAQLGIKASDLVSDDQHAAMLTVPWPVIRGFEPTQSVAREISAELLLKNKVEVPVFCFDNRLYFRVSAQAYNHIDDYQHLIDAVVAHRYSAVRNGVG